MLPDLPVVHFKDCRQCDFTIAEGTKVVKVIFHSIQSPSALCSLSFLTVWEGPLGNDGAMRQVDPAAQKVHHPDIYPRGLAVKHVRCPHRLPRRDPPSRRLRRPLHPLCLQVAPRVSRPGRHEWPHRRIRRLFRGLVHHGPVSASRPSPRTDNKRGCEPLLLCPPTLAHVLLAVASWPRVDPTFLGMSPASSVIHHSSPPPSLMNVPRPGRARRTSSSRASSTASSSRSASFASQTTSPRPKERRKYSTTKLSALRHTSPPFLDR